MRNRSEYNRRYFASERGRQVIRAYETRNREKRNAYNKLRRAIARGDASPAPESCQECGATGKVEGHHDDYALPLSVRWLCRACHKAWHSKHGEARNG